MELAALPDFDDHALVTARSVSGGATMLIAVHNDHRGPAMGGCRIYPYPDPAAALADVLRLSRGMTYKNAIAGIPYGGGKAVVIADPATGKTPALLHAIGDFVASLNGRYITSFDSGTSLDDVRRIGERTDHVAGTLAAAGNASESTALGVHACMQAAAEHAFGNPSLTGLRVAIQGLGNVGARLADLLARDGAVLTVADAVSGRAAVLHSTLGARIVGTDEILFADVDIVAPCALGAVLSRHSIPGIRAKVVVGGANNQLARPGDDRLLADAGIVYCPDYLANAGGIINLHHQRTGWSRQAMEDHVLGLADTFREVMAQADATGETPTVIADSIAERRFGSNDG